MDSKVYNSTRAIGDCMGTIVLSTISKIAYLDGLIGRIYKILPLFEELGELPIQVYIGALMIDVNSANELFDGKLVDVLVKLNSIHEKETTHKQIKKTTFECTNMVQKMKDVLLDG